MTHEFLLDLDRRSGFVQARTVRVPSNGGELACCCPAQFVNDNPLAVRSGFGFAPFAHRHSRGSQVGAYRRLMRGGGRMLQSRKEDQACRCFGKSRATFIGRGSSSSGFAK